MKKRTNRVIRQTSSLLTPAEHDFLILNPRIHLTGIIGGYATKENFMSVAGVLNIASALAAGNNRKDLVKTISDGQSVLLELVRSVDGTKPTNAQETTLCDAFNVSDKYLGIQRKHHLERAIKYVESRLLARKDVDGIVMNG